MSEIKTVEVKVEEKSLVPVKSEEKSLVVVEQNKNGPLATIDNNKELIIKVAKRLSIALIGTISIVYIVILTLVATSVFYVSNLRNKLKKKRSLYKWN